MHHRTAWDDYFPGTSPTTPLSPNEYNERNALSGTYVYVSNCLFSRCTSTSSGGALNCNSVTYLLVESSSFFSCKTSSSSGAIYMSGSCQFVLHRVCGNDCCTSSSSYCQFVYTSIKNDASSKNYINYSSIARCVNELSNSWCTLYLWNGKICCPSINSSNNKCGERSGISCAPFADSSSVICSFSYSSFADNNATYNCIWLNTGGAKYEIKCCNILRNTQVDLNSVGTIRTAENLRIPAF
jgi:hypothetical protein